MPEENNDLEIKPVTDGENQNQEVTTPTEAPQEAPQEPTVDPHKSFDLDNLKTNVEEESSQIETQTTAPAETPTNISEPTVTVSTTKESSFKKILIFGIIIILILTGLYLAYQYNSNSDKSDQNTVEETPEDMKELEELVNTLKEQEKNETLEDQKDEEETIEEATDEEIIEEEIIEEEIKTDEIPEESIEEEIEPDEIPEELENLLDEAKNNNQSASPPGLSITFPSANEETTEEEEPVEEVIMR